MSPSYFNMPDSAYILRAFREMVASDVQGGSVTYAGATLDCTLGVFELENVLIAAGGGYSPRLLGTIEIAAEDFDKAPAFSTGQLLDVTDRTGVTRHCKIDSWKAVGPLWSITLVDQNQGA